MYGLLLAPPLVSAGDMPCMADLSDNDLGGGTMSSNSTEARTTESTGRWNLRTKTLGGRSFWGDVTFYSGWRIQQNVFTKHYRLINPRDVRYAWGSIDQCQAKLRALRADGTIPPMAGKACILVHGIIRSSKSLSSFRTSLEEQGYTVIGFDYPSTRGSITQSAEYLRKVIDSLEGIDQIDFVVHSMGGLIVRALLTLEPDCRLHRMVMIAVPNLGAELADRFRNYRLFRLLYGPAGQQLATDPNGLIPQLPTPPFEFAVVAGTRGKETGYNPLLPGEDDGTVTVDSTRLPGATDFLCARGLHSFLLDSCEVVAATVRFLQTGALRESGEKEPIPSRLDR